MFSKETLPKSIDELQTLCLQLQSSLIEKDHHIDRLEERLSLLLSKRYQSQSEQLKQLQCQLFDEAELEQAIEEARAELAQAQSQLPAQDKPAESPRAKQKPKRTELPKHLRRVEILIDVSEEDKHMMGDDWELIGYETSEQLAVNQREYYVKQFKRAKYVPKQPGKETSENNGMQSGIKVAPPADVILPKSLADASLLADILASKFVDAVPFYRKMKILERERIHIGYSTVCDWPIQLHQRLQPIKRLLYEQLSTYSLWHLDETGLQVLNEPGRENTQKSYLMGIRAGPPKNQVVLFHYDTNRGFDALESWLLPSLEKFQGAIISDEHKAYNKLKANYPDIKAHGGCWAHLRRKYADAAKGRKDVSDAHKMLTMIAALYRLETGLSNLEGERKKAARQKKVKPQVEKIKQYLDQLSGIYTHDGLMNKAIRYSLNNWPKFTAFLDYPELPIDNNPIEQAIRPFTLGRKNFLFSGSPKGAEASAFIYSLVETAKACGWEPKAYLQTLFECFPQAKNDEERRKLLPMFLKPSK